MDIDQLSELFSRYPVKSMHALHLKAQYQNEAFLDKLTEKIDSWNPESLIIFDLKPETAKHLKQVNPKWHLAPSVAHEYDIKRYNECVGRTLISINEAIQNKTLFDWVWLDEWDLNDEEGEAKTLYTAELFKKLRTESFKIALVTPELHATSPSLLGGEVHQDAKNKEKLFKRIKEIVELEPDMICTDYPQKISNLIT
jgi:hypothetical protein